MPAIEIATKGSPIGINTPIGKRHQCYLVTIRYLDGTAKAALFESRCTGFLRDGLLGKRGGKWLFYDASGELSAARPVRDLGQCTEVSDGFYIFVKPDGTATFIDAKGTPVAPTAPFLGAEHSYFFRDGITPVLEGMRRALAHPREGGA